MAKTRNRRADGERSGQSARLTRSNIFDMLSNARRRYVLAYLRDRSRASIRDLSRELAAWENDVDPAAVSSKQRKRVYTALHQTHLPRLDEYGVVAYDRDRGGVRATERLEVFEPYLEEEVTAEPKWSRYYVAIGLVTVVWAAGLVFDLPILTSLAPGLVGLVLGAAILTVAGLHATGADVPDIPVLRPARTADGVPTDD